MIEYYKALGLNEKATLSEVRKAYKNLAKKYHPDVFSGDKNKAEEYMKYINLAYEELLNIKSRENITENTFKAENKITKEKHLYYCGCKLTITDDFAESIKCRTYFVELGNTAAENYILKYLSETNIFRKALLSLGFKIDDNGLDLLNNSIKYALDKGLEVVNKYENVKNEEVSFIEEYLLNYIKVPLENCIRFYIKSTESNKTLSSEKLSVVAYKLYSVYIDVGRGVISYLKEKGYINIPTITLNQVGFALKCENDAREGKIKKGEIALLKELFDIISVSPDRIENYCLLYYLYGDDTGELNKIVNFFGMSKAYECYKDEYCNNNLRIDEEKMFHKFVCR